jgi:hypothetical protein
MELSLRDWQPGNGGASSQPPNRFAVPANHLEQDHHTRWTVQSLPRLVMRIRQSHDPSVRAAASRGGSGRRRGAAAPAPTSTRSTCCAASCARCAFEH